MYGFTISCDGNAVEQLRKIDAALKETGINAKVQIGEIESQFTGTGEKIKNVVGDIKGLLLGGILAGGVFGGIEFLKGSKDFFDEMEKSVARVNQVLKSTNFAAGLSSGNVIDQADLLNKSITQNRAEIMDAQGMLLSFTDIKGPVFGETTKAVADFATFYKEDMITAALQIGKALNNPAEGMGRLLREGVEFTDEQKKQIKNYQEQGDLVDAQKVILKELQREFGGQSTAFALTDEGKIRMDEKQWEDLKLQIGEIISKTQLSLLPMFAEVRDIVKEAFESGPVQFFINHIKDLLAMGLKIIPMWTTYKVLQGANLLRTAQWTVNTQGLTIAMGEAAEATTGAAAATEAFGVAWSSVGIGAIAVAFGLLIDEFVAMNEELDKAIEKKYKLSDSDDFYTSQARKYESIKERLGLLNDPNFGVKEKQELYTDIKDYLHTTREKIPTLESRATGLKNMFNCNSHNLI